MNGKGSARRPSSVSASEWERRWALAFGPEREQEHAPAENEPEEGEE
jgi:hypothetical protein